MGRDSSVVTAWTVPELTSGGGGIFRIHSVRPWDPRNLLYPGYRVSFPGVKLPWHGVDHPPPSSVKFKEVELYLYSPSGSSWPVLCYLYLYILKH